MTDTVDARGIVGILAKLRDEPCAEDALGSAGVLAGMERKREQGQKRRQRQGQGQGQEQRQG
ncbi:MAG TPA: hypothetical protein VK116_09895, partial [Planctomycetota bacterium]|nr:hypothetical protein [Planctomycetota bacterium]